jgi:hypothetical protein
MNKKGMAEAVLWIIRIIMLVMIVAVIHYIKIVMVSDALDTYDTEFYIMNSKLLYSPDVFAYTSMETGRTYPGIIDPSKFNEATLNQTISRGIPARLTLRDSQGTMISQIYNDKERYDILEPLVFAKQYDLLNKTQYVLIKDDSGLKPGMLTIEMVVTR